MTTPDDNHTHGTTLDHDHDKEQRGWLETSVRCVWLPFGVVFGMLGACLGCKKHTKPREWSCAFRVVVAVLKSVTTNVVRSVCCVRWCTDYAVPTWLPTLPSGIRVVHQKQDDDCPCGGEWTFPTSMQDPRSHCPDRVILYLHGGAFALCNPTTHRGVTMRIINQATNYNDENPMALFAVDYRRPPQHAYPEPVQDCVETYKWLLERMSANNDDSTNNDNAAASRIVLGGDSAGGALVILVMVELKRQGIPLPAGGIMISPWVDLQDFSSSSWSDNQEIDYLPRDLAKFLAHTFIEGTNVTLEQVSASNQDLSHFPPLFVMCGSGEVLHDQVLVFCEKARRSNVEVTSVVEPGMIHAFVAFSDVADCESVNRWYGNIVDFVFKVMLLSRTGMNMSSGSRHHDCGPRKDHNGDDFDDAPHVLVEQSLSYLPTSANRRGKRNRPLQDDTHGEQCSYMLLNDESST